MNEIEIKRTFNLIIQYYEKYLKDYGVKPIKLKDLKGNYTKDALVWCIWHKTIQTQKQFQRQN